LFKIARQDVSLWHFHVYMYYSPFWFIFPILLLINRLTYHKRERSTKIIFLSSAQGTINTK
jgi:hypothetical protein